MKKKFLIVPMTLTTVVAPVATTVACGKTPSKKDTSISGVGSTKTSTDTSKKYVNWVSKNTKIDYSNYSTEPFTPDTLKERAIAEKDDTFWNGGLLYHAFSQTISIIKGLAHAYGYDEQDPVTKRSPRDEFLEKTNAKLIADNDLSIDPNDSPDIQILKNIKSSGAKSSKTKASGDAQNDLMLKFPDFYGLGGFSKYHIKGDFDTAIKYDGTDQSIQDIPTGNTDNDGNEESQAIENAYFKAFAVYNDPENPGQLVLQIEDVDSSDVLKALREVKLPHMSQVYPIIDDNEFNNKIVPIIKNAITQMVKIMSSVINQGMLNIAGVNIKTLFDEIKFLQNILFDVSGDDLTIFTPKPELNSESFTNHLKKLNNGSAHWLALEAFDKGLNSEFTVNNIGDSDPNSIYEWVTESNDAMINKAKAGDGIKGLANVDASDMLVVQSSLLPWTSFGEYITRSSMYVGHETLGIDKDAFLAATPSYGFDEPGLQKSFDRLIK